MEEQNGIFENDDVGTVEPPSGDPGDGFAGTVSGNMASAPEDTEDVGLGDLLDALDTSRSYGTMGDYYNQQIGCYVFPDYDVYAYFVDVDADGAGWCEASDGHYIPVLYLDAYESYIASDGSTEPEEVLPTESDLQNQETLESIRGILSVIKENNAVYYEQELLYSQETLAAVQEMSAKTESVFYVTVTIAVLFGIMVGSFFSHVFWNRMRAG